ncbi:11033_t:CDS:2 [Dentiscutata heterogama]|uniref:11033_t:CDS:1 n=1 Tax=Dentiscutata heterogama TaxID=1316150 RepID=A0ACA9LQ72_9GLOM|nr:11033_t:CDS:2 [Dentiscutata heterogama]
MNTASVEAYPSGRPQSFADRLPYVGNNASLIQMNNLSFFPTFNLIPSRRLRRGCDFHIDMKTSAEYKRVTSVFSARVSQFKYRSSSKAHHEYGMRLNQALQEAPDSRKLLNLRGKWDNDEYRDDWARYEDLLEDRKTDKILLKSDYST